MEMYQTCTVGRLVWTCSHWRRQHSQSTNSYPTVLQARPYEILGGHDGWIAGSPRLPRSEGLGDGGGVSPRKTSPAFSRLGGRKMTGFPPRKSGESLRTRTRPVPDGGVLTRCEHRGPGRRQEPVPRVAGARSRSCLDEYARTGRPCTPHRTMGIPLPIQGNPA